MESGFGDIPAAPQQGSAFVKHFFAFVILGALTLLAVGCGHSSQDPVVVEIPGYQALQEQFTDRDLSPLKDRRIVLDPGHGGFFQGAVGTGGLTEAEVNLGVGLYLRGLLEWAGAEVHLTRTADYDFLTPADSSLASDLAFRVSFTDSLQPDVFLSLHHNSVASLDRTVNETQTYYPLGDDGASLDLARAIHRHLVINLEITPAKILPGNFHVLRNASVPAVLGEPAMISNPVIEGRLSLAASQRLEAEAYFLGLLDYFSQGAPRWAGANVDTLLVGGPGIPPVGEWTFLPEAAPQFGASSPGPDIGTFEMTLDGQPVPFNISERGRRVTWYPNGEISNLPAILELRGRNLRGRATPVRKTILLPEGPPVIDFHISPSSVDSQGERHCAARWKVSGGDRLPAGSFLLEDQGSWRIVGGIQGAAILGCEEKVPEAITFKPEDPGLPSIPCRVTRTDLPAPWAWGHLVGYPSGLSPWSLRHDDLAGLGPELIDQTYSLVPYDPMRPLYITLSGALPLIDPDPANPDTARTVVANNPRWVHRPLVQGLRGKVIVLDPAGGGSDNDGSGPLGTRGSTLNLETALLAKGLLEGCGATVHLTRSSETVPPAEEKVRRAGALGADLFLTIGRSSQPGWWQASHHHGSDTGARWADLFIKSAAGLASPGDSTTVHPAYDYLLRHTACPALEIRMPGPMTPEQEMRLLNRGWQRAEARAILLSVVSLFHGADELAPSLGVADMIRTLPGNPDPQDVDWAELDGNFIWSPMPGQASASDPDSLNSWRDPGLPDLIDRHTLEIHSGNTSRLWLLERTAEGFTGRLMMINP